MTEQRDHYLDPADSSRECDLSRIHSLVKWISHTKDAKAMAVGINAIEAILEGNPHLRPLKGFMGLTDQLHEAQELLPAPGILSQSPHSSSSGARSFPLHTGDCHLRGESQYGCHGIPPRAFLSLAHRPPSWQQYGQRRRSKPSSLHHHQFPPFPHRGGNVVHAAGTP